MILPRYERSIQCAGVWWSALALENLDGYGPEHTLDGSIGVEQEAFTTAGRAYNWVRYDFGRIIHNISRVEVVKRHDLYWRFLNIEVRIGNTAVSLSFGRNKIEVNGVCGSIGWGNQQRDHFFDCPAPMSGRFMTLQISSINYLEFDEIYVHQSS